MLKLSCPLPPPTWQGFPLLEGGPQLEQQFQKGRGVVMETAIVDVDHGIVQLLRPAHGHHLKTYVGTRASVREARWTTDSGVDAGGLAPE